MLSHRVVDSVRGRRARGRRAGGAGPGRLVAHRAEESFARFATGWMQGVRELEAEERTEAHASSAAPGNRW